VEALEAFRQSYLAVLFDIASDAGDFEAFRRGVEEFFHDTSEPARRDWDDARQSSLADLYPSMSS
jgi:hypothetical protein